MKCKKCGGSHDKGHPHLVSKLNDKGFPVQTKGYATAHEAADKAERKKYPKGYEELKKLDRHLSGHELIGKNTKSGKIEVSKKAPKRLRKEIAFHEQVENDILRKKK